MAGQVVITPVNDTTYANGTSYYPAATPWILMAGFDDVSVVLKADTTAGAADDTVAFTFEASNDGTLWQDVTSAGYSNTNDATNQTYACAANATFTDKVDFDNLSALYFRVVITVVNGGASENKVWIHPIKKPSSHS